MGWGSGAEAGDEQDEEPHGHDSLAPSAGAAAQVGRVIRCLGRKGGQPEDGEDGVYHRHGMRLREPAGSGEARSHAEIDPCWDGEEALSDL